jgi:quinol monooxygenase YgiN
MATILAHIKIFPGREAEFEKTARALWEATHRLEPHCRRYEYFRGAEPGHYYCLLSFDDFRAFMTHQTSDHHEAPDFASLLQDNVLEWLDPVQGASDLAPTEPQTVPDDAGALTRRYAQDHAVVMQEWWKRLR